MTVVPYSPNQTNARKSIFDTGICVDANTWAVTIADSGSCETSLTSSWGGHAVIIIESQDAADAASSTVRIADIRLNGQSNVADVRLRTVKERALRDAKVRDQTVNNLFKEHVEIINRRKEVTNLPAGQQKVMRKVYDEIAHRRENLPQHKIIRDPEDHVLICEICNEKISAEELSQFVSESHVQQEKQNLIAYPRSTTWSRSRVLVDRMIQDIERDKTANEGGNPKVFFDITPGPGMFSKGVNCARWALNKVTLASIQPPLTLGGFGWVVPSDLVAATKGTSVLREVSILTPGLTLWGGIGAVLGGPLGALIGAGAGVVVGTINEVACYMITASSPEAQQKK